MSKIRRKPGGSHCETSKYVNEGSYMTITLLNCSLTWRVSVESCSQGKNSYHKMTGVSKS